jgi:hypothetical protein
VYHAECIVFLGEGSGQFADAHARLQLVQTAKQIRFPFAPSPMAVGADERTLVTNLGLRVSTTLYLLTDDTLQCWLDIGGLPLQRVTVNSSPTRASYAQLLLIAPDVL